MISLRNNRPHTSPECARGVLESPAKLARIFLVAACVCGYSLGQPSMAALVTPSGVINTKGTSTFGLEFPGNGETNFSLRLNDDWAVGVDLEPSVSAVDELFNIRLSTKGITALNDLTIRWEKGAGLNTASAPPASDWSHFNSIVFTDRGYVDSASVSAGDTFYEVFLTFTSIYADFVQFDFLWPGFNDPRSEFSMTFDPNGVAIVSTPIPGGIWLFGSGLIALMGFGRRPFGWA